MYVDFGLLNGASWRIGNVFYIIMAETKILKQLNLQL